MLNLSYSRRWDSEIEQSVEENRLICATLTAGMEASEEAAEPPAVPETGDPAETDAADEEDAAADETETAAPAETSAPAEISAASQIHAAGEQVTAALRQTRTGYMLLSGNGDEYYSNATEDETALVTANFARLTAALDGDANAYTIVESATGKTYIAAAGTFAAAGQSAIAISFRDVTPVFELRAQMLLFFRIISVIIFVAGGVAIFFYAHFLTRPIEDLAAVSAGMASGDYSLRCDAKGDDEIGDLGRTFNFMADSVEEHIRELTEENRRKEEFVANFTHEIKTPMTSVIGYADMIRSRDLSEKTRTLAADYIFNEGMRLQTMSLKLFELFLTDESNIEMKRFALRPWVEDVAKSVFPKMYNEGIGLQVSCPNLSMTGEADLLKTAFINILDNARKASPKGSSIRFRVSRDGGDILIEVEDHGIGIPQDEIEKITEAFYMVDKSRSRESGGAGLGLALTQKILKLHGSRLEVRSQQGVGTVMSARFAEDR
ncbi:MAG: HAMP domain-containing histidine kinase [Lachnospiraceae bacterium]|nr:HAMP domain-containing histidine kinase [Lachnospiraceae bacterium]